MKIWTGLFAILFLVIAMSASAVAVEQLDQYQNTDSNNTHGMMPGKDGVLAQTFTAGVTGNLTRIVLRTKAFVGPADPVTVEIRDTVNGAPGVNILGSSTVDVDFPDLAGCANQIYPVLPHIEDCFVLVNFSFEIPVIIGESYAIYSNTKNVSFSTLNNNPYSGGQFFSSSDGGANWNDNAYFDPDMYFETYVEAGMVVVPDMTAPNITNVITAAFFSCGIDGRTISVNFDSDEFPINATFELFHENGSLVDTDGPIEIASSDETGLQYTIPLGIENGTYVLNMTASDISGNSVEVFLRNVTVCIAPPVISDTTAPTITNIVTDPSPIVNNGSEQNVTINFTSSEHPVNVSLDLVCNESINDSLHVGRFNNFNISFVYVIPANLSEGICTIRVAISDDSLNAEAYDISDVNVSYPVEPVVPVVPVVPVTPSGGGPSDSTGTGGGFMICENWTECDSGIQTRVCNDGDVVKERVCVSIEMEDVAPSSNNGTSSGSGGDNGDGGGFFSLITGAVIGGTAGTVGLGIIILLVIVALIIVLWKRRKK